MKKVFGFISHAAGMELKVKRLKHIMFIIVLLTAALTQQTSAAFSEDGSVRLLLRPENFTLPDCNVASWRLTSVDGTQINIGALPGTYLVNANQGLPVEAEIYLPADDEYIIWALARDAEDNLTMRRHSFIGIDGKYDANKFGSYTAKWEWHQGASRYLEKGWHTVQILSAAPTIRLCAVMITNDLSLVLDDGSIYNGNLENYEDIVPPSFNGDISIEYLDSSSIIMHWPSATDNKGICNYRIYINDFGKPIFVEGDKQNYKANGLYALEKLNIKIQALDDHGNMNFLALQTKVSPFDVSSFDIVDSLQNAVSHQTSLVAGGRVGAQITLENRANTAQPVILGVAVYEKYSGRMVASKRESIIVDVFEKVVNFAVNMELPSKFAEAPEDFLVYAALWDTDENIAPQETGILLIDS